MIREDDEVFRIKYGDTYPSIVVELTENNDAGQQVPVDESLIGAAFTFAFRSVDSNGMPTADEGFAYQGFLYDDDLKLAKMDWPAGSTERVGLYAFEVEVHFPDGRQRTHPNDRYRYVEFVADLDDYGYPVGTQTL